MRRLPAAYEHAFGWLVRGRFAAAGLMSLVGLVAAGGMAPNAGRPLLVSALWLALAALLAAMAQHHRWFSHPAAATAALAGGGALDAVVLCGLAAGLADAPRLRLLISILPLGLAAASTALVGARWAMRSEAATRSELLQRVREPVGIVRARADSLRLQLLESLGSAGPGGDATRHDLDVLWRQLDELERLLKAEEPARIPPRKRGPPMEEGTRNAWRSESKPRVS